MKQWQSRRRHYRKIINYNCTDTACAEESLLLLVARQRVELRHVLVDKPAYASISHALIHC
jgi:hypothetical protein